MMTNNVLNADPSVDVIPESVHGVGTQSGGFDRQELIQVLILSLVLLAVVSGIMVP